MFSLVPTMSPGADRGSGCLAFCIRMKSTLTKRGVHSRTSGYRVGQYVELAVKSCYLQFLNSTFYDSICLDWILKETNTFSHLNNIIILYNFFNENKFISELGMDPGLPKREATAFPTALHVPIECVWQLRLIDILWNSLVVNDSMYIK